MLQSEESELREIEEVLGPREGRFFGSGYQTVRRSLRGTIEPDGSFKGTGNASYLKGWSLDGSGVSRQPHLSTVDVVAFAGSALDLVYGHRDHLYIDRIGLRSGSAPFFQLDEIPVEIAAPAPRLKTQMQYTHAVLVGNMRCDIGVRACPESDMADELRETGKVAGDGSGSVYGELFARQRYRTWVSALQPGGKGLRAHHDFDHPEGLETVAVRGLDSAAWPSVTMFDYVVLFGQLTQVLLAEQLGLDRTRGELWMRKVTITRTGVQQVPTLLDSGTQIVNARTVERGERLMHHVMIRGECSDGAEVDATVVFVESR